VDESTRGGRDPGYFGHGVIGKEQYEKEKLQTDEGSAVFGPGVLGLAADAVNKPGPGVAGQEVKPEDVPPTPDQPRLSIKELEEALEENPALVDKLLDAEFARPEGVRKGALQAIEIAESLRPDGPREDVLQKIAAALDDGA